MKTGIEVDDKESKWLRARRAILVILTYPTANEKHCPIGHTVVNNQIRAAGQRTCAVLNKRQTNSRITIQSHKCASRLFFFEIFLSAECGLVCLFVCFIPKSVWLVCWLFAAYKMQCVCAHNSKRENLSGFLCACITSKCFCCIIYVIWFYVYSCVVFFLLLLPLLLILLLFKWHFHWEYKMLTIFVVHTKNSSNKTIAHSICNCKKPTKAIWPNVTTTAANKTNNGNNGVQKHRHCTKAEEENAKKYKIPKA